jgi:hypothetical protein
MYVFLAMMAAGQTKRNLLVLYLFDGVYVHPLPIRYILEIIDVQLHLGYVPVTPNQAAAS